MDLRGNVAEVRRRIASAGDPERVRLVAVSKGFGADVVDAVVRAGVADVGESYAQELLSKAAAVAEPGIRWHFIGRLQTNKVRQLEGLVELWHTVDRAVLGDELAKRAPGANVLLQVNVSGQPHQGGCHRAEAPMLVARLRRAGLDVRGLMAIGKVGDPRPGFRLLRSLADDLGLEERSMGMSGDLEVAVEEGATIVRVGRALFGERPRPGAAEAPN